MVEKVEISKLQGAELQEAIEQNVEEHEKKLREYDE